MVLLVLLQWDVLGPDYDLIQLLLYNYWLLLNKDQEIKVFHLTPKRCKSSTWHSSSHPVFKFPINTKFVTLLFQAINSKGFSAWANSLVVFFCFLTNYYLGNYFSGLVTKGYKCWLWNLSYCSPNFSNYYKIKFITQAKTLYNSSVQVDLSYIIASNEIWCSQSRFKKAVE